MWAAFVRIIFRIFPIIICAQIRSKEALYMYYSSGNYEAFARPQKPKGVDQKSAYIIGTGLAALTAACYLVRDGQMKGEQIHLFE